MLLEGPWGLNHVAITKLDILACGTDTANLKLIVGYCIFDTVSSYQVLSVVRHDKNGLSEDILLQEDSGLVRDFALASDNIYPAANSNPFSLAVAYSKGSFYKDSIVVCTSGNGGLSFNKHYNIAASSHYFHRVALTYGRSPSCSTGRYFAAWEEQDNANSISGHIFTAHSEPNFNSPFTLPVLLDSLDASTANKASNPVISCQNNNADNDSANLTEVVLFEKYQPISQNFNIAGFYNKKTTTSTNFRKFSLNASPNSIKQPDIAFNPYDSTFMVTWFDSTAQKLPYFIHDYNMTEPDTWVGISAGYNDEGNLTSPCPQLAMDFARQAGSNAWIGTRAGGNGAAMFDSPFTYYVGSSEIGNNKMKINIFPNPATEFATLEFDLPKEEKVEINLINTIGQSLYNMNPIFFPAGKHLVKINITKFPTGIYIAIIHTGDSFTSGKIIVNR